MTPPPLDGDVIERRLALLRDTLDELEALRGVTADRLAAEPLVRAAAERLLQVTVDLAVDINAHVAVAVNGAAPSTGRASFADAARAGALPVELADELAPSAGLRNLLVHRYADVRVELVAAAVDPALDGYRRYVAAVSRFLLERGA